jgi:sulfatase maturation enzyme AslB (radical SAM superfamily)
MLTFVGGEPLYEKKNFEVLQRLLDAGNKTCFISFTTNGSVELTEHQLQLLKEFVNVNFSISIDGIGPVFEYLRFPLKWDSILNTIAVCRSIGIEPSVSYTISNLNILYYKETIDWFVEQKLNYNHNLVTNPSYFSINALPAHIKNNIVHGKDLLRNHDDSDDGLYLKFVGEVKRQDALKKIKMQDYLPTLAGLIEF